MTDICLPSPVELAELLCSRVCHDLIGPIGAIGNGFEVLDEEDSEDMRPVAMDLIRASAASAASRLAFARLAFGFAGGAGDEVDVAEAEQLARAQVETDRTRLDWSPGSGMMAKDRVKLILVFVALAAQTLPRGGVVSVTGDGGRVSVEARGSFIRVNPALPDLLAATPREPVIPRTVVALYAGLLAAECGLAATVEASEGAAVFRAA